MVIDFNVFKISLLEKRRLLVSRYIQLLPRTAGVDAETPIVVAISLSSSHFSPKTKEPWKKQQDFFLPTALDTKWISVFLSFFIWRMTSSIDLYENLVFRRKQVIVASLYYISITISLCCSNYKLLHKTYILDNVIFTS